MARKEKVDRNVGNLMEEIEQKMFLLKIDYEKYFTGIERIEPLREREVIKRMIREMQDDPMRATQQRFKYQTLKARFQSLELYWTRNLVQIERGTHPKMKFRADLHAKPVTAVDPLLAEQQEVLRQRQEKMEREERSYKLVFDKYVEARAKCGQSTDLSFEAVREALHKQVRLIKSTYQTENVKFRILIEDGKAKVKAVPQ